MDLEPGTIVGGKYRLEQPLSRGGMGSVWCARHVHLGSPVAIKFMAPEHTGSSDFRNRFYREARTAANLQSANVVTVQDFGIEEGIPFIVMEMLRGEDLGARLKRTRRITVNEAARVVSQAGKALRRAHEAGLVHRDLKPSNLFIANVDDDEIVKILDFGIVKETDTLTDESTKTGELLGSPYYMSPEQARGDKDLDLRSDLWSLGVILFRAVTGQLPFQGDTLGAVLSKILVEPTPTATKFAPDLPAALDAFFARAFARDRDQRFQSAAEMVRAFGNASGVTSSTPSLPETPPCAPGPRSGTLLGLAPPPPHDTAAPTQTLPLGRSPASLGASTPLEPSGERALQAEPSQPGTFTPAMRSPAPRRPWSVGRVVLVALGLLAISTAISLAIIRFRDGSTKNPTTETSPALASTQVPPDQPLATTTVALLPTTAKPSSGDPSTSTSPSLSNSSAIAPPRRQPPFGAATAPAATTGKSQVTQPRGDVVDPWGGQ